ncbi:hypothetical protein [Sinomonas cellulolyticus]|uniref:Uncharacterized protein n=1 Tax=Sinomonas cellulolyticus TaxID=2801916 RepID=A0ABS1K3R3_9MICC|nr:MULTISPECIES: hypothetical protein [Sinomonas]MBL0706306.1 hypothetical protein [Sinomonas cellulolyticus]
MEWLLEQVARDVVLVEVDVGEEREVEFSALVVTASSVEPVGIAEEVEAGFDELGASTEVVGGRLEAGADFRALVGDVHQLRSDLILSKDTIGCEVDQVGFLSGQRLELF